MHKYIINYRDNLSTTFSILDQRSKRKINNDIEYLIILYPFWSNWHLQTLHAAPTAYTLFASAPGVFPKTDHTMGHKKSVINYLSYLKYVIWSHWNSIRNQ